MERHHCTWRAYRRILRWFKSSLRKGQTLQNKMTSVNCVIVTTSATVYNHCWFACTYTCKQCVWCVCLYARRGILASISRRHWRHSPLSSIWLIMEPLLTHQVMYVVCMYIHYVSTYIHTMYMCVQYTCTLVPCQVFLGGGG